MEAAATVSSENHLTAASSLTTLLSFIASQFTTSYKFFGYVLFIISGVISLTIMIVRYKGTLKKHYVIALGITTSIILVVSILLAGLSIMRPPPPPAPTVVVQPSLPLQTVRHDSNKTTGTNSPVITGDGGTYYIGNNNPPPPSKTKKPK